AADVRNSCAAMKLLHNAVQCGQPFVDDVRLIAGPEELRDGAEKASRSVVPPDATTIFEGSLNFWHILRIGGSGFKSIRQIDRTVLVREHGRLLWRHCKAFGRGFIGDVI